MTAGRTSNDVYLPLILLMLAVLIDSGFETYQLVRERLNLNTRHEQQEPELRGAGILKAEYNAIMGGVFQLAKEGDKNVLPVLEQLKQMGIVTDKEVNFE